MHLKGTFALTFLLLLFNSQLLVLTVYSSNNFFFLKNEAKSDRHFNSDAVANSTFG